MVKVVIIDCRGHLLGRLASIIAKQLLLGQHIVCVRTEEINISGGIVRQKMKYERFLNKRTNSNPLDGPFHFRAPSRILWRVIRGMIPQKTKRGQIALQRLKAFEGMPSPYDKKKRMVIPDALKAVRMDRGRRFCKMGDLSFLVGWKHKETVAELEENRKAKSLEYYQKKKKVASQFKQAKEKAAQKA